MNKPTHKPPASKETRKETRTNEDTRKQEQISIEQARIRNNKRRTSKWSKNKKKEEK